MPPSPARPKSSARLQAELFGRRGETVAAWFLRLKLYRIVGRRIRTPHGELDLVARRFGVTAFIEVKARKGLDGEYEALLAVNRRRIVRAAQHYLTRHPELAGRPLRFDVIFLAPFHWPRHVVNAFDAS